MSAPDTMASLERVLEPVALDDFFERHWGRRALFVKGEPGKHEAIYSIEDWRNPRALGEVEAAARDDDGRQRQTTIEPEQIPKLFEKGMTICADVTEEPRVAAFLRGLRRKLRVATGTGFAKVYASPDGSGFAMHTDAFHVFVMQVAGRKRWRYSTEPAVPYPMHPAKVGPSGMPVLAFPREHEPFVRDDGTPVPTPEEDTLEHAELSAGDCLYLPPGTWHRAEAVGESIAISVSPPRASATDVVVGLVEALVRGQQDWREDVVATPGVRPEEVVSARMVELAASLAKTDSRAFERMFCEAVERATATPAAPPSGGDDAPIERRDRFERLGDELQHVVAPSPDDGAETLFFYHGGSEWTFPAEAEPFLRELARRRDFVAEEATDWDSALTWEEARDVLSQLLAAGIVRRRGR